MRVIPSGKSLGAEVTGINLSEDISDAVVSLIIEAWRSHLVLIFRDQSLTDDILVSFSALLGELDPPAPNPNPYVFDKASIPLSTNSLLHSIDPPIPWLCRWHSCVDQHCNVTCSDDVCCFAYGFVLARRSKKGYR